MIENSHARENSIVLGFLRLLLEATRHSRVFHALSALDSLLARVAAASVVLSVFRWDLRDEATWDSSIPGRLLSFVWSTVKHRALALSAFVKAAISGSIALRIAVSLFHALQAAFGGSMVAGFVKGIFGIRDLGAPSAGGALLAAFVFVLPFLPTSLNLLAIFGLLFVWALICVVRGDFRIAFHRSYVPAFLLFTSAVVATVGSVTVRGSVPALMLWASYAALFFVSSQWVEKQSDLLWIAIAWIGSSLLVSLLGFRQYTLGVETAASWVDARVAEDIKTRVHSVFDNPNMLAEYLTYAVALCAALLLAARSYLERLGYLGALALTAICLTVTFSRGGWVATAFALLVIGVVKDRRLLVLLLVGILVAPAFVPETLLSRAATLVTLDDSSAMYRITIWKAVLRMINDKWATGVGLGSVAFSKVYPDYEIAGTPAAHSHNLYLQIVAEMGVLALLLFMWTIYSNLRDLTSADRSALRGRAGFIAIALVAGTLGQLLHGMIDNVWYSPKNVMFFWLAVGVSVGARLIQADRSAEDQVVR